MVPAGAGPLLVAGIDGLIEQLKDQIPAVVEDEEFKHAQTQLASELEAKLLKAEDDLVGYLRKHATAHEVIALLKQQRNKATLEIKKVHLDPQLQKARMGIEPRGIPTAEGRSVGAPFSRQFQAAKSFPHFLQTYFKFCFIKGHQIFWS